MTHSAPSVQDTTATEDSITHLQITHETVDAPGSKNIFAKVADTIVTNANSLMDSPAKSADATHSGASGESSHPWHNNIAVTFFWVGEEAEKENVYISNLPSAWDEQWAKHYGGVAEAPTS